MEKPRAALPVLPYFSLFGGIFALRFAFCVWYNITKTKEKRYETNKKHRGAHSRRMLHDFARLFRHGSEPHRSHDPRASAKRRERSRGIARSPHRIARYPGEPAEPDAPETPGFPNEPSEPTEPGQPDAPAEPESPAEPEEPEPPQNLQLYILCTGNGVNLRSGAGGGYSAVATAEKDTSYAVIAKVNGWYCVYYRGKKVYMAAAYAKEFTLEKSENSAVEKVLEEGYKLLGTPYVYGAVRLHDGAGKFRARLQNERVRLLVAHAVRVLSGREKASRHYHKIAGEAGQIGKTSQPVPRRLHLFHQRVAVL